MGMFSKQEFKMLDMEPMTRQEELHSIYWDMYKAAYGYRPRGIDTSAWTEYAFKVEFEHLAITIEENEQRRRVAEQEAAHAFEMRIQSILACGAKDREMALRWIHEAEGSNGDDEFLCYLVGLPYQYFRKVA
jgi:epoxyqueuosine reductase QueG